MRQAQVTRLALSGRLPQALTPTGTQHGGEVSHDRETAVAYHGDADGADAGRHEQNDYGTVGHLTPRSCQRDPAAHREDDALAEAAPRDRCVQMSRLTLGALFGFGFLVAVAASAVLGLGWLLSTVFPVSPFQGGIVVFGFVALLGVCEALAQIRDAARLVAARIDLGNDDEFEDDGRENHRKAA